MRLIALTIALLAVGACGTAMAAGWTQLPPTTRAGVVTDGERFAAYQATDGALVVLDELSAGPSRFDIKGCQFTGPVRVGRTLVICGPYSDRQAMVDLVTGDFIPLPDMRFGAFTHGDGTWDEPIGVSIFGQRWLEMIVGAYHWTARRYVTYDARQIRTIESATRAPALDSEQVARPLCAPVRRAPNPEVMGSDNNPRFANPTRDGAWVVTRALRGVTRDGEPALITAEAWRCGARRPTRLSNCKDTEWSACQDLQASAGTVTWSTKRGVRIHDLKARRARTVRWPMAPTVFTRSAHTRSWLFTNIGDRAFVRSLR